MQKFVKHNFLMNNNWLKTSRISQIEMKYVFPLVKSQSAIMIVNSAIETACCYPPSILNLPLKPRKAAIC